MTGRQVAHHETADGQLSFVTASVATNANQTRRETLSGREYLVAEDVTAVKSMELKGMYLPPSSIKRSVPGWQGIPLPGDGHPTEGNKHVSANTPQRIANHSVGRFYNVSAEDKGGETHLVGDLYIDVEKSTQLAEQHSLLGKPLEKIQNGEPLSLSTAYYFEEVPPREHDYSTNSPAQVDILPDHLALLPSEDQEGECSLEDSCGFNPEAAPAAASASAANTAGDGDRSLACNCGGSCACSSEDRATRAKYAARLGRLDATTANTAEYLESDLSTPKLIALHSTLENAAARQDRERHAEIAANLAGDGIDTEDRDLASLISEARGPTADTGEKDWGELAGNLAGDGVDDRPDTPTRSDWGEIASDLAGDH